MIHLTGDNIFFAWGVTTDPGSIPGGVTTGLDWESQRAAHNWLSIIRVRGAFGGALLGSSRSSDSLRRSMSACRRFGHQLNGVKRGLAGHVSEDAWHDRARWWVAAMRQDRNWISRYWGEKYNKIADCEKPICLIHHIYTKVCGHLQMSGLGHFSHMFKMKYTVMQSP
jgi:hypothetical protein